MQGARVLEALRRFPRARLFLVIAYEALMALFFALPRFSAFNAMKATFLRLNGAKIGRRVTFYPGVWITPGRNLIIGDDVDLAVGVLIESAGGVEIGARTLIGHGTKLIADNHVIPANREMIFKAGAIRAPIKIGCDVWIGANCVILSGRTVGDGAVVGAASVVAKDVEPYTIVAGNPAKLIRVRN